jgi:hypothetical protein
VIYLWLGWAYLAKNQKSTAHRNHNHAHRHRLQNLKSVLLATEKMGS